MGEYFYIYLIKIHIPLEKYYFYTGHEKFGPFSIEELKNKHITSNTPIWKEGLKDWVKASDLEEVNSSVLNTPPPFNKSSLSRKTDKKLGRTFQVLGLVLLIVIVIIPILFNRNRAPGILTATPILIDPEHLNPANYLQAGGTYRPNFWGTKYELSGTITNIAAHTNYKDVHVKIKFFTRTNTLIGSKEYILYDYFPYGLKKSFTITVDKPTVAASCGWQVIGATVY
jgi:hypothetical protein